MPKKVLLVDDDEVLRRLMSTLLTKQGFEVIAAENGPKALAQLKTTYPDIILLDVMMPAMDGFAVCRKIRSDAATARIPVIMLTALDSVENKVKGFEAGADDYLSKPCDTQELIARINVLIRRAEAFVPPPVSTSVERETARTIAVFSLRGGSGVSTIAVNLAAALSQLWNMQTALVDMVAVAGQSALFLNQSLRHTWADLCRMDTIDEEAVLSAMLPHETRLRTLASPRRPEESELLTSAKVRRTLEVLRAAFPYVVLDMPHDLSERSLAALDQSDIILLVTQPEIASLRAASLALETMQALGYQEKKTYMILNWTFPRQGLALKDIERVIKAKIDLILPYAADEFVAALNFGTPPVLSNPESPLGAIFEDMAMALSKDTQRQVRPEQPTPTWKRVAERLRKKKP